MPGQTQTKESISYWNMENIIKTITTLVAVFGFVYGVYQYINQKEREYRQKIYESQLELYKKLLAWHHKSLTQMPR